MPDKRETMIKTLLLYARYNEEVPYRVPLGIAYISAVLRKNGFKTKLKDGAFYRSYGEFKKQLEKEKPDVIGISTSSFLLENTKKYVKIAKETLPLSKIIIGGPHCSVLPKLILKNKDIDLAVYGEGEETFLDIVKKVKEGKPLENIQGTFYRKQKKIIEAPPRPWIDLDKRPLPDRDLLLMKKYLSVKPTMPIPYPATDIEASRGCFGNCIYCQPVLRKMFGKVVRNRDPVKLVDEIEYLIKMYKIKGLNLGNDEPIVNRKWVKTFCDEIIKRKIKIKINSPSRVDTLDLETMKKMKKAGFIHLSFGVESGSQKILDVLRKGTKVKQIENAFALCEKVGIAGRANIMVGSPEETKETIKETIDLIKRIKADFIYLSATTPTPGSDLYDYAKKRGMLNLKDLDKYKNFDVGYLKLKNLTTQEVYEGIQEISKTYKKLLISYFLNPFTFWKKKYLFKILFCYYFSLLRNPKEFIKSLIYSINYGKHIKKLNF